MFNVYWGSRLIGTYPQEKEDSFKQFCNQRNIIFQYYNDNGDYLLFPVLKGINIALCPLDNFVTETEKILRNISEKLTPWGALAVYIKNNKRFMKLIQILNVQILLGLTNKTAGGESKAIKFFYSLKKKDESLAVTAAIIERLIGNKLEISYEVSNYYDFLLNINYLKYYIADVPTILIEINGLNEEELAEVENAITDGLLAMYGKLTIDEQLLSIKDLTSYLETKSEDENLNTLSIKQENLKENEDIKEDIEEQKDIEEKDDIDEKEDIEGKEDQKALSASIEDSPIVHLDNKMYRSENTTNIRKVEPKVEPLKKKRRYRSQFNTSLYPPDDGPVYQFIHTKHNEMYDKAAVYMSRNEKKTFSSFNKFNNEFYNNTIINNVKPFEQTEESYNVFDELKGISRKIMLQEEKERISNL